ncbi:hypothetical protein CUN85_11395 [Methanolobus halotolerans]|uniref:Uncharacterized protein n=1 Tax=Methanolobus halotolerans TaxID=2052935 RepID=A0A4E0QXB8_9EURY|nr:hypothetical protein CUN85_11395 [Methanolobus halotolerans]
MNVTIIYYFTDCMKIKNKSHNLYTMFFFSEWWYFLRPKRKIFDDDSAIELPINIVVMLVVGIGLPL